MTDKREKSIYRVTLAGTAVNAVLIVLKFVAGTVGRSSALVADAVHSLSDFITDIIVLVFIRISGKPHDEGHEYGHGKYETMATLVIGIILCLAGMALCVNGIRLVANGIAGAEVPRPHTLALVIAMLSIVSKEILYRYTIREGRRWNSGAVIANAWHHRSDAISSIGTLVGVAGAMFLGERWRILDPLATIVVSVFIIKAAITIIKPNVQELLESALPGEMQKEIKATVMSVDGIKAMHRLRTRRIGNAVAIDFHAKMDGALSLYEAHAFATEAEHRLRNRFGRQTIISIHMEPAKQ